MKEHTTRNGQNQNRSDATPSWTHKPDHILSENSNIHRLTQNLQEDYENILQTYPRGIPGWHPQYIALKSAGLLPEQKTEEERQKELLWMKEDAAKNLREKLGIFWDGKSFQKVEERSSTQQGETIQTKTQDGSLSVSRPDDKEEVEADRMADRVMREQLSETEDDKGRKEQYVRRNNTLQLKNNVSDVRTLDQKTESRVKNLNGKGSPLPASTRESMENNFSADLTGIRIHIDSQAVELSQKLNAKAFTYGNNIAFNQNEYSPDTPAGKRLLAHELTHTIQQGTAGKKVMRRTERDEIENKKETFINKWGNKHGIFTKTEIGDFFILNNIFLYPYYYFIWGNKFNSLKIEIVTQNWFHKVTRVWEGLKIGNSNIKIEDDRNGFRDRILIAFKKIMSTPTGRNLITAVANSRFTTVITSRQSGPEAVPDDYDEATPGQSQIPGEYTKPGKGTGSHIYIGSDIKDGTIKILGPKNKIQDALLYEIVAHELGHTREFQQGIASGESGVISLVNRIRKENGMEIRESHKSCDTRKGKKCISIHEFQEGG